MGVTFMLLPFIFRFFWFCMQLIYLLESVHIRLGHDFSYPEGGFSHVVVTRSKIKARLNILIM